MEKRLEKLLLEKKFSELTAEEKYYVTETVDETEYRRLQHFLMSSKTALKTAPRVNPALKARLLASVKANKKPTVISRILGYRIPAWQAAAAVALLFGLHLSLNQTPLPLPKTETVYVHSTDTIYKEVAMPVAEPKKPKSAPRVNVKPKQPASVPVEEATILAYADTSARKRLYTELPDTFNLQVAMPHGQSAAQTADLWEMLGTVY